MRSTLFRSQQTGFSLLELMTALGIFLVICGAAFTLLDSSQQRARAESQLLTSFQEARLGLDQIVRDVNDAGYPPPTYSDGTAAHSAVSPFAWSVGAGYPGAPCQIGTGGTGNCTTAIANDNSPGDFDLIIETNPNPVDPICAPNCAVKWIRYQLQLPPLVPVPTLMRGVVDKSPGTDPDGAFTGANALVPFVQNVVNNSSSTQIAQYQLSYPNMFPGGAPVPIFSYTCDAVTATQPCPAAGGSNAPNNIRDVIVTLIVASPFPDPATGQPRLIQLSGRGRRINPNQ